ncbi:MAG: rRNA ((1915)-N(3))-methyltransferase RlmH [Pseudomonadota bacterium]|jgi:23S rRNA (pseudouridine1915-N3)-methyltransferase
MNLHIIALGKGMPNWVEEAFISYQKRLPTDFTLYLKELKAIDRLGNTNITAILAKEAEQLQAVTPKGALRIVLDERGKDLTTVALSDCLVRWQQTSRDIVFYIGSTDGLDSEFKKKADMAIRLSSLTLPHMMVRVLLAEQLYRAWSILNNHPYHRV